MSYLTKEVVFKRKLKSLFLRFYNIFDNNNKSAITKNGEDNFLKTLNQFFIVSKINKPIVFDVGANIGLYTKEILSKMPDATICSFEPSQINIDKLNEIFKQNANVKIVPFAASDETKELELFFKKEGSGHSSLYDRQTLDNKQVTLKEIIKTIRLEDFIEQNNIEHINFLKLDIEGHEAKAIEGLSKYLDNSFIDFIQFEYGGTNIDSRVLLLDFYNLLGNNFILAKIKKNSLELRPDYQARYENFQNANYVAISKKVIDKFSKL